MRTSTAPDHDRPQTGHEPPARAIRAAGLARSALDDRLDSHHRRIRDRGVNRIVYWLARAVLEPVIRILFLLGRHGREHVPASGGVILASNHRSFLDPFLIGVCARRPIYFLAKRELFERRLSGRLLNALGAFPVCRGDSDEEAMTTARRVLQRGDPLVIFPEGSRMRRGPIGPPRRGVGRLALETGVPVVPVAVAGSERARRGWLIRPCRIGVRFGSPLTFPLVESPSPRLAAAVTRRIWPCVQLQWEWLGGVAPLRDAVVVGAGPMGTALATVLARGGMRVTLGCRSVSQAGVVGAELERAGEAARAMRASPLAELDLTRSDLVVLAVPTGSLPAVLGEVGDRIRPGAAVLLVSKGLVPPLGTTPARYVGERLPANPIAWLGGPAHAAEAAASGASVVLASRDEDVSLLLCRALSDGGLDVERTDDVVGAELAGVAKNLAALAASAAAPAGMNAAGAAAGRVFAEVHELARARGARPETFAGLAGAGDLVATALAPGSRNRRAGELLSEGLPAEQIGAALGATAEALDAAPLFARVLEGEGRPATTAASLAALVEGRLSPAQWLEQVKGGGGTGVRQAA